MASIQPPTTRARARQLGGLDMPKPQWSTRSSPSKAAATARTRTKKLNIDVDVDAAPPTASSGTLRRRASLEQGDGLDDTEEEDKLREALRRSASGLPPPSPEQAVPLVPVSAPAPAPAPARRPRARRVAAPDVAPPPTAIYDADSPFVDAQPSSSPQPRQQQRHARTTPSGLTLPQPFATGSASPTKSREVAANTTPTHATRSPTKSGAVAANTATTSTTTGTRRLTRHKSLTEDRLTRRQKSLAAEEEEEEEEQSERGQEYQSQQQPASTRSSSATTRVSSRRTATATTQRTDEGRSSGVRRTRSVRTRSTTAEAEQGEAAVQDDVHMTDAEASDQPPSSRTPSRPSRAASPLKRTGSLASATRTLRSSPGPQRGTFYHHYSSDEDENHQGGGGAQDVVDDDTEDELASPGTKSLPRRTPAEKQPTTMRTLSTKKQQTEPKATPHASASASSSRVSSTSAESERARAPLGNAEGMGNRVFANAHAEEMADAVFGKKKEHTRGAGQEQGRQETPRAHRVNVSPDSKLTRETSHALASLEASLARLGAGQSRESSPSTGSTRPLRESPTKAAPGTRNAPLQLPDSLRGQGSASTPASRHQARLLCDERGTDEAGNSPRKQPAQFRLPAGAAAASSSSSSSSSDSPSKSGMSFLERARAARAQAMSFAAQQAAKEEAALAEEQRQAALAAAEAERERKREEDAEAQRLAKLEKANRRKSFQVFRSATPLLSEDEEDEARVEREVTPVEERSRAPSASADVGVGMDMDVDFDSRSRSPRNDLDPEEVARKIKAERKAMRAQRRQSLYAYVPPRREECRAGAGLEIELGALVRSDEAPVRRSASALRSRQASPATAANAAAGAGADTSPPASAQPPPPPPRSARFLKGVVVLVDVRDQDGEDASPRWVSLLKSAGAKVASRVPSSDSRRTLTHIVWKSGKPSTLNYFRALPDERKPLVVGINWVVRSLQEERRATEGDYLVEVGKEAVWQLKRRRSSMAPRMAPERTPSPPAHATATATATDAAFQTKALEEALQAVLAHAPLVPSPLRCGYSTDGDGGGGDVVGGVGGVGGGLGGGLGTRTLLRARSEVGMRRQRREEDEEGEEAY